MIGVDIIVATDGQRIEGNRHQLEFLETQTGVGQKEALMIVAGQQVEVRLELGEAPQN